MSDFKIPECIGKGIGVKGLVKTCISGVVFFFHKSVVWKESRPPYVSTKNVAVMSYGNSVQVEFAAEPAFSFSCSFALFAPVMRQTL